MNIVYRGDHIDFEQMLLDYGEMLMSHQSYWQVGLTYLEQCKVHGWDAMKVLMLKLPLTSEEKALKIIAKAKEYNVTDVGKYVCFFSHSLQEAHYNYVITNILNVNNFVIM